MINRIFKKNGFLTIFTAIATFAVIANAAGIRYKDRLFDVNKEIDIPYASNVPALSSLHSLSELTFSLGDDSVFFYTNENDVSLKTLKMDVYTPKNDTAKKITRFCDE